MLWRISIILSCIALYSLKKFPIKEFFNIQDNITTVINLEESYTCSGDIYRCCDCDYDCMRHKTCCIDKLWNETNPIPIQEYLDKFEKVANKYKDLTCEDVFPSVHAFGHTSERLLMVSSCLPNANIKDTLKCLYIYDESYESTTPVFGIDKYLYKNAFCSKCNFVEEYEIVNITANCKGRLLIPTIQPIPEPPMPGVSHHLITPNSTTPPTTTTKVTNKQLLIEFEKCFFKIVRTSTIEKSISPCRQWKEKQNL